MIYKRNCKAKEDCKAKEIANGAEREWLRCSDKELKKGKGESMSKRRGYTREQCAEPKESLKRVEGMSWRIC